MNRYLTIGLAAFLATPGLAAVNKVEILPEKTDSSRIIPKEIYGQFAEHLGTCIYGGLWVGEDSPIPNTDGYRNDVLQALRDLSIPVLRWPGGCFADEYHWTDGIGPKSQRPRMVNNNWGGTIEDNSFGTHEFFNLCELLGTEPYLSGNVGSGTVAELATWIEYITAEDGPQATKRKENGREKPWHLKYLGVGNESWGCGGNFLAEDYAREYRRYQTYCRNFNGNQLFRIASGASDYDFNWTDVLMDKARYYMDGLSLHYYTVFTWSGSKGAATKFTDDDYYWTLGKALEIGNVIKKHCDIMDKYDPDKKVGLMVDEWGTWWDEEPGTTPGHLYQQNTMRDAMVAALSLNTFHTFTDRVKMTNIAQIANVLQSMVLTKDDKMVLTPTYYVFKMYKPHQDATWIPLDIRCDSIDAGDDRKVPMVSATASKKDDVVTMSFANTDLKEACEVVIPLTGIFDASSKVSVTGEILTADNMTDHNDFDNPSKIAIKNFDKTKIRNGMMTVTLPPMSIVSLSLK